MVRCAASKADRPALEAALTQAAEQYNRGACSLDAFVMRMVAVSGREAVVESLDAVGWCSQVRLTPSGSPRLRSCVRASSVHLPCISGFISAAPGDTGQISWLA